MKKNTWKQYLKERIAQSPLRLPKTASQVQDLLDFGKWLKDNDDPKMFETRELLYGYVNDQIINSEPIDYLEFGVYKGESIRAWTGINSCDESRFFGFDSFSGLPEDWSSNMRYFLPKGSFDTGGIVPDIDDSRVQFIRGYFQHSLPDFIASFQTENRLVIHCDADLYTSTLYVLASLDRYFTPGTILMFDEFSSINHEFKAFDDYVRSFARKYRFVAATPPFYLRAAIEITE